MASYDDLNVVTRLFLQRYPFSRYTIEPGVCAKLSKPLDQSRIAIVTTAGVHTPEQEDFDYFYPKGDVSFREIPASIDPQTLLESHRSSSWDHRGVETDKNLAFPIDRLRELEAAGVIGELSRRHLSFMGSIIGPAALIERTAPQAARLLKEDQVDAVLLTPV
jgi:D-proline reductase (dithiol) PrdB